MLLVFRAGFTGPVSQDSLTLGKTEATSALSVTSPVTVTR